MTLNFFMLLMIVFVFFSVSAPPLNVRATQSGSSAPVEVSWSPPSDGANIITGYRIFYGNGKNASVSAVATLVFGAIIILECLIVMVITIAVLFL